MFNFENIQDPDLILLDVIEEEKEGITALSWYKKVKEQEVISLRHFLELLTLMEKAGIIFKNKRKNTILWKSLF